MTWLNPDDATVCDQGVKGAKTCSQGLWVEGMAYSLSFVSQREHMGFCELMNVEESLYSFLSKTLRCLVISHEQYLFIDFTFKRQGASFFAQL